MIKLQSGGGGKRSFAVLGVHICSGISGAENTGNSGSYHKIGEGAAPYAQREIEFPSLYS